ncbi:MAG TPA: protein kinase, partial [Planctomycetaceae bacterium]|nr:protein kinase [Planctomycetaceae bacterium]
MPDTTRCPDCGADLPTGGTAGLCPKCLMRAGLADEEPAQVAASPFAATTPQTAGFIPPEPRVLAPYFPQLEILGLLGHGGMGAVYKARQRKLDRLVALKIIRPESADDPAFAERFNREARTLARLSHPHIVAVHDFGEVGPACRAGLAGPAAASSGEGVPARQAGPTLYYFVMEYVGGPNLRELLERGDLQPAAALAIVPQICEALQYAHDEGVVHRDIKPENILLDPRGRVKIADFGLAKLSLRTAEDFTLTATHQVMGTPRYMAPEQMAGSHAVDHRADIYSLGVVFYEMLTGEVPMGHFAPPSKKSPAVDARLDDVVLRALASEPERRYQQASDLETDVEAIAGRDSESRATLAAATPDSRPGMSSMLEQSFSAAAEWFGGHRESSSVSSVPPVRTADVIRGVRGPGLALMLYGLLLLLPAAFLGLNGYDIADGNDATPWGVGVGLIVAGLAVVGVCGLLLWGGWHMLTLGKYQP